MKKVILLMMMCMAVGCSQGKFGQGGQNACQFVKEQLPGLRADIQSVEVINEDTLLSGIGLTFAEITLAQACEKFIQGTLSKGSFTEEIDSLSKVATDIYFSWKYSTVANDSLKLLPKYEHLWRRVYTLRITMKSGVTREPRVLMDSDGITPICLEKDIETSIENFTKKILEAQEMTWVY